MVDIILESIKLVVINQAIIIQEGINQEGIEQEDNTVLGIVEVDRMGSAYIPF